MRITLVSLTALVLALGAGAAQNNPGSGIAPTREIKLVGHQHDVTHVCFSPNGKWVMSGDEEGEAILWNALSGKLQKRLPSLNVIGMTAEFTPDSRKVVYGVHGLKVWDVASGKVIRTLNSHPGLATNQHMDERENMVVTRDKALIRSLAFSPNGRWLAVGSDDKTIEIWNLITGKLQRVLKGHTKSVNALAFSPNGQLLASGGDDTTIRIWSVKTGASKLKLTVNAPPDEYASVHALSFSGNRNQVTALAQNGYVVSVNVRTGAQSVLMRAGNITNAAFSGDGRRYILGTWEQRQIGADSYEGVVRIGNTQTGKILFQDQKKAYLMSWMALSRDGKRFAIAGTAGMKSLRIWDVSQ